MVVMPRPPADPLRLSNSEQNDLHEIGRHGATHRVSCYASRSSWEPRRVCPIRLLPANYPRRFQLFYSGADGTRTKAWVESCRITPARSAQANIREKEAAIVEATMRTRPQGATHWSVRMMAHAQGVSRATVHRIWRKHKLQPHRVESFKFSTDPDFVPKVRDVVGPVLESSGQGDCAQRRREKPDPGLGSHPADSAASAWFAGTSDSRLRTAWYDHFVCCPERWGRYGDRHCQPRHRHQEFLLFLDKIDASVQPKLEIHIILDNYGTHKHPSVKNWFTGHPRYTCISPDGASWLNQIERWFAEITRKRIRRGTFRSVRELVQAIREYIRESNKHPRPFQWVASGDTSCGRLRH